MNTDVSGVYWTKASSEKAGSRVKRLWRTSQCECLRWVARLSISWVWDTSKLRFGHLGAQPLWMDIQFVYRALYLRFCHLLQIHVQSWRAGREGAETLSYARVLEPTGKPFHHRNPPSSQNSPACRARPMNYSGHTPRLLMAPCPLGSPQISYTALLKVHIPCHPADSKPWLVASSEGPGRDSMCTPLVAWVCEGVVWAPRGFKKAQLDRMNGGEDMSPSSIFFWFPTNVTSHY